MRSGPDEVGTGELRHADKVGDELIGPAEGAAGVGVRVDANTAVTVQLEGPDEVVANVVRDLNLVSRPEVHDLRVVACADARDAAVVVEDASSVAQREDVVAPPVRRSFVPFFEP